VALAGPSSSTAIAGCRNRVSWLSVPLMILPKGSWALAVAVLTTGLGWPIACVAVYEQMKCQRSPGSSTSSGLPTSLSVGPCTFAQRSSVTVTAVSGSLPGFSTSKPKLSRSPE
jgi:hypothetical protein